MSARNPDFRDGDTEEFNRQEIRDSSICNLPSKELVTTLCKQKGSDSNHVVYSAGDMKCFIKYNNVTLNEAHSQLFSYNQMKQKSNATIRIP